VFRNDVKCWTNVATFVIWNEIYFL